MDQRRWLLQIDRREEGSRFAELARQCARLEVQFALLPAGDYIINGKVTIERKTHADLAVSIVDGRLFRQAAAMARSCQRSLFMVEGPAPTELSAINPHAVEGAVLSLAVSWRMPVIFTNGPEDSLRMVMMLAEQSRFVDEVALPRFGYRPRRLESRKLYILQGLPGVGPKLARSLLRHFGSVEKVMQADPLMLTRVPGCGCKKAATIRKVLQ